MAYLDLTPDPRVLRMLGQVPLKGWQCIAELLDNSIDSLEKDSNENLKIKIEIPPPSELNLGSQITIDDNGNGMKKDDFNNALRAGYSGKSSDDNLGLFGMGFNCATAKLGNRTTVWTSTKEMNHEIGVEIDLLKMQRDRIFKVELKERNNTNLSQVGKSGTSIAVDEYTPEGKKLLINRPEIKRGLMNAYSKSLFEKYKISCWFNNEKIKGKEFLLWDHEKDGRHASYKSDTYPPFVNIQEMIVKTVPFCTYCLNEITYLSGSIIPSECQVCGETGNIIEKDYKVSGWLGIQRFFSSNEFGLDIVRNGRIIEQNTKEIFKWEPREKYNIPQEKLDLLNKYGGVLPEYPIDNKGLGGRIVGELYVDFIKPLYTKDSFERTELWKDVLETIRGESPLQNIWATKRLGMSKNKSPLSRLFHAYRNTEPGQANLVCGTTTEGGGANAGNRLSLSYRDKFIDGDVDYQDDEKWYELVIAAEGHVDPDEPPDIPGPSPSPPVEPHPPIDKPKDEHPGDKRLHRSFEIKMEIMLGVSKKKINIYHWWPPTLVFVPIIHVPISGSEWNFLVNQQHPVVSKFTEGSEELVLMEIAHRFEKQVEDEDFPISRIYFELKKEYFAERLLDVDNLNYKAKQLLDNLIEYLVNKSFVFTRKPDLNSNEISTLRSNYLQIEDTEAPKTSKLNMDTSFIKYMDKAYLIKFVEFYPEFIFDNNFFNLPYIEIEDNELRRKRLDEYKVYFNDIYWLVNNLSDLNPHSLISQKPKIIKAKLSLEHLINKISG